VQPVLGVAAMTDVQLAFDIAGGEMSSPATARPALSDRVPGGPARLLRKLVAGGLDPQAVQAAAALVAALDAEVTS
jgi:hypothetical protein